MIAKIIVVTFIPAMIKENISNDCLKKNFPSYKSAFKPYKATHPQDSDNSPCDSSVPISIIPGTKIYKDSFPSQFLSIDNRDLHKSTADPIKIPIKTVQNNMYCGIPPDVKTEESELYKSSASESMEELTELCKYCKKEIVCMKGSRILKTCKTCLMKKREYEESRGKTLRLERVNMYKERYSILCSTCHTRKAMRKNGKQLHTCERCAKYKRSKYLPKKADFIPPFPTAL